ncbi:hypothetical protein FRACA_330037 [Frankia canadensis]|uniref:Uncharacterized protein n=1 Tax=Frankia canadensis TaxID=1836972 RepID=A0A2I2KUU8_9ACTN|nr:hypothetical protein FRACA_330037 [Frankia canadensis]SOU56724.1 hypothetical protein FRACA_330037 [Frankia canadensis]
MDLRARRMMVLMRDPRVGSETEEIEHTFDPAGSGSTCQGSAPPAPHHPGPPAHHITDHPCRWAARGGRGSGRAGPVRQSGGSPLLGCQTKGRSCVNRR